MNPSVVLYVLHIHACERREVDNHEGVKHFWAAQVGDVVGCNAVINKHYKGAVV